MKTEIEQLRREFNERIDALLKEETYEPNKWYKSSGRQLIFITRFDEKLVQGYGFGNLDNWWGQSDWLHNYKKCLTLTPATDKEVEDALIAEAKKRGFKEGVRTCGKIGSTPIGQLGQSNIFPEWKYIDNRLECYGCAVYREGEWAEIIQDEVIKIGGYEVKKTESGNFLIGCKTIMSEEMKHLQSIMAGNGFKTVSFDGTEVSLETINKIINKL